MTGRQNRSTDNNQLWRVAYPSGETTRLTDDFNDYYGVSPAVRETGAVVELASVILSRRSQLWRANLPAADGKIGGGETQLTEAGGDDGYGITWARSGRVFYGSQAAGNPDIWTMKPDGSDRRQLTFDAHLDSQPHASPDGRRVVFASLRSGIDSLWRMNADGSEQTLLAEDTLREPIAVAPDGWIYYHSTAGGAAAMWRIRTDGGGAEKLFAGKYFPSSVSPNGRFLAAAVRPESAREYSLAIFSIDGESAPRLVREFKPLDGADFPNWLRWSPGGKFVAYTVTKKGIGNLWAQPVAGGAPVPLTNFDALRIYSFDFSPDGRQVICARGELTGYVVLLTNQ